MGGVGAALSAVRTVLDSHQMRRVLLGYLAFAVTEWAVWVGVLVYAHDVGGSNAVGWIAVAQLIPAMIVAPLGSTLADRLPRQYALALAYGLLGTTVVVLGLALVTGAPTGVVVLAAVASNCAVTLCRPAHFAALPRLAGSPEELIAANSASTTMESLGVFAGPAFIAVVTSVASLAAGCLALGVLMASVAVMLLRTRAATYAPAFEPGQPVLSGAVEGLREVRRTPGATTLLLLVGIQFVVGGALDVLGVVFPLEELNTGPAGPSLLIGAIGVGGLIGAVASVLLVGRRRLSAAFLVAAVASGAPLALVGLTTALPPAVLLVGMAGFARAFFDVAGRTLLQRAVRPAALARVFGLTESVLMGGLALGAALTPLAIDWFGVRGAFVALGCLPVVLSLLGWPRVRRMDAGATVPVAELELLRQVPLFRPLAPQTLEALARAVESLHVPNGTPIITQGDDGDRFYLVRTGQVRVVRDGAQVAALGDGQFFGEVALLRDQPRNATVVADGEVDLVALDRDDFLLAVTGSTAAEDAAWRIADERS